jgi:hypothetical protein
MRRLTIQQRRKNFLNITHWRGSLIHLIPEIYLPQAFIFGKEKRARIGQEIPDEISLFDAVTEIVNGISIEELQRAFRSWIERVENVITAEGGYACE